MSCGQQEGEAVGMEMDSHHESTCETCSALGDPSDPMWIQLQQH